jgi:hypothetical protein
MHALMHLTHMLRAHIQVAPFAHNAHTRSAPCRLSCLRTHCCSTQYEGILTLRGGISLCMSSIPHIPRAQTCQTLLHAFQASCNEDIAPAPHVIECITPMPRVIEITVHISRMTCISRTIGPFVKPRPAYSKASPPDPSAGRSSPRILLGSHGLQHASPDDGGRSGRPAAAATAATAATTATDERGRLDAASLRHGRGSNAGFDVADAPARRISVIFR